VVRMRPGATATPDELRSHAAKKLAPYKVPVHIWLTGEVFPRSATGKLLKREMQARYAPKTPSA
jgi:long-chain acyl-CoA synthetase